MISINLPNLWSLYPYQSLAITVLVAAIVGLCLFQAIRSLIEVGSRAGGKWKPSLASLALTVALLALLFTAARWVYYESVRARPRITSQTGKVLSNKYSLEWTYPDEQNGRVKYYVTVTDKATGMTADPTTTFMPNIEMNQVGDLLIQVDAEAPGSSRVKSEMVEVQWYYDSMERIGKTKQLVVAVHPDISEGLFCYNNNGKYEGVDIDLIEKIRTRLQATLNLDRLDVKQIFVPWPDIISRPNVFDVDFAIASISITPERAKVVDFSEPYWRTSIAVVERGGAAKPEKFSFQEFSGKTIGVHKNTTEVAFANLIQEKQPGYIQIVVAQNNTELFALLENGAVNAVLYDFDRTRAVIREHWGWSARPIDYEDMTKNGVVVDQEKYGISFAKLNGKLRHEVNQVLLGEAGWIKKQVEARSQSLSR
jgi:ABC-type amino acid transport substrate-binding protein